MYVFTQNNGKVSLFVVLPELLLLLFYQIFGKHYICYSHYNNHNYNTIKNSTLLLLFLTNERTIVNCKQKRREQTLGDNNRILYILSYICQRTPVNLCYRSILKIVLRLLQSVDTNVPTQQNTNVYNSAVRVQRYIYLHLYSIEEEHRYRQCQKIVETLGYLQVVSI